MDLTLFDIQWEDFRIAGKNRYLTAKLQLETERYLGEASDASQIKAAMNGLQSNIVTLKQGGMISGVDLKPLPSEFFELWNNVSRNSNLYETSVNQILAGANTTTSSALKTTTKEIDQFRKKQFESIASDLIASSDRLVTQLGLQTDKNSDALIIYQVIFGILVVGILILILYLVARMLKPIFDLTQATSKIKKGNFDVSVTPKGTDELSVLAKSFNSMTDSMSLSIAYYELIQNHCDLTTRLEAANEELETKDRLKDELINIAAHELRAPVQPILGQAEILRRRKKSGGTVRESNSSSNKQEIEQLDIIIRNAKRLLRLDRLT